MKQSLSENDLKSSFPRKKISEIKADLETFAIPVGVLIVTLYPEFEIMVVNDVLAKMFGFDDEADFLGRYKPSAWEFIYSEDVEQLKKEAAERSGKFEPYEVTYRALKKDGSYIWVNQYSRHMLDEDGEEFVFAYYTDITTKKQAEQLIDTALHGYDVSIWEWDISRNRCYQSVHSSRCTAEGGVVEKDFPESLFKTNHYHPDSIETARSIFDRIRNGEKTVEETLRTYDPKEDDYWWESVCYTTVFDHNGKPIKAVAVGKDVTVQKEMEAKIKAGVKKYETLVNSIPGGVAMYRWDETFTPIFISAQVYKLCDMTKEEYEKATQKSTLDVFHPDDRKGLIDAVSAAYAEKRQFNYIHRVLQQNGSYRWMRVSGEILPEPEGIPVLYTVFTDLHEQVLAEQALRESEFRYSTAVKSSNINIWEYDLRADRVTIYSNSPRITIKERVIDHYAKRMINSKMIRADSQDAFRSLFERLNKGEKEVSADIWFKSIDVASYWCERITCTNIFDNDGCPVKAFGVGRDVTKEKEAEKRYHDELSYRRAMQKATLGSINVNLTQNCILEGKSQFSELAKNMKVAKTAQDYFEQVYGEIIGEEMQKKCATLFNRDEMLKRFFNGETSLSMEILRNIGGERYWTMITAHMMKKAEDEDVVAFLYSTDITNEKTMYHVMDAIVKTDYDFLVVVDAEKNSAIRYSENKFGDSYVQESHHFEEETQAYVRKYIRQEDVEHVVSEITLKNILAELDAHGTYSIFYTMADKDGTLLKKQLRFNYIEHKFKSFLMTRTDITTAVEEQEKKNKELLAALEMVKRANAAKSEFLSRISHEIRTPMNAIMGLAQVASYHLDDTDFVMDCIKKSRYAAEYLLALIDDVLDMSKMENEKVALRSESIDLERFFAGIKIIIGAQAETKNVHFEMHQSENLRKRYEGDSIRLQQILVNILSNAIKFTPEDGKVSFYASEIMCDGEKTTLCFKITDTGIGIGKAFLRDIFKPFVQEHSGVTTRYGGSGLGLAISKNLAQMMAGDIQVESVKGEGTTFTVNVKLKILPDLDVYQNDKLTDDSGDDYDFSKKKILLIEDHILNIMVARKLLEYKHIEVDIAENGKLGFEQFRTAPEHYYDGILMDIRMPVMDGLEAAKNIRQLDQKWAKAVPIIAMSANVSNEDIEKSMEAGMNAHLAKPIDSKVLYRTLQQFLSKESEKANG